MKLEIKMNTGTLKKEIHGKVYDALRNIQYDGRATLDRIVFKPDQEYLFETKTGAVRVTFEIGDLN